jgi:hypothetical protein
MKSLHAKRCRVKHSNFKLLEYQSKEKLNQCPSDLDFILQKTKQKSGTNVIRIEEHYYLSWRPINKIKVSTLMVLK